MNPCLKKTTLVFAVILLFVFGFGSNFVWTNRTGINPTSKVDKLVQAKKQDSNFTTTTTRNCPSLHQTTLDTLLYFSPPFSPAWNKTKRILSSAQWYLIGNGGLIFSSVSENVATMLEGYGLRRLENATVNTDYLHGNESVVLLHYSFQFPKNRHSLPMSCQGSRCSEMPQIFLQAEQLPHVRWATSFVLACHELPNCVSWDFTDVNVRWANKTVGAVASTPTNNGTSSVPTPTSESIMIFPIMFQNRLRPYHPKSKYEIRSLQNRTIDVAFFGLVTWRRRQFYEKLLQNTSWMESHPMVFEKTKNMHHMTETYASSKVCFVLHSYHSESGGEYHRMSDFLPFGCQPVMETFADHYAVDIYQRCGGIVFADYDNLLVTVDSELTRIASADHNELQKQQMEYIDWWSAPIEWKTFLHTVFEGPFNQSPQS